MSKKQALSLKRVKALAKRGSKGDPGLDAMWAAGGWMIPVQLGLLLAGGASVGATIGVTLAVLFVMLVGAPFAAAILEGFDAPRPNAVGWTIALAACGWAWWAFAGTVAAAVGVAAGAGIFAAMMRRHLGRAAAKRYPRELPRATAQRIAALPGNLERTLRKALDRALAAHQSLVALVESPALASGGVDAEGMRADAIACIDQIVDRTENALRLHELPTQSEAVIRSREQLADQVAELSRSLTAAVDAAAVYVAAGESEAARELAERAEHLHDVARSLIALQSAQDD